MEWFVLLPEDSEEIPDILLLDIHMPEMNGFQFLEAYKNVHGMVKNRVQIYLVSASYEADVLEATADNTSISGFIAKPFKDEDLELLQKQFTAKVQV